MPALFATFYELGSLVSEAEFIEWYENTFIPARVTLPFLTSCSRWWSADDSVPRGAALYELTSLDDLERNHGAIIDGMTDDDASVVARLGLVDARAYALRVSPRAGDGYDAMKPGPYASVVEMDVPEEMEADLNRWYDEEHIPMLMKVPQWVRSRRFELKSTMVFGSDEALKARVGGKRKVAKYLAIHEYTSLDAYETEEWKRAASTPWMKEIISRVMVFERRVLKFDKSWKGSAQDQ